ncbi:hypothetical protein BJY18_002217 [Amycolatopsis jiangsuensis]|uniref:Peptidase inhibitor family I36 n=1 Tax=Amycolatopsis jiangsuensis TaxID=1181879 RepID=A0A840IU33_9PSEU|nr:hypothetical protein [Amycolatopsis jiangsuensis]
MKLPLIARFLTFTVILVTCTLNSTSPASADSTGKNSTKAGPACLELENGSLCLYVSPINQQGQINVTYEKWAGSPFLARVAWVNPTGTRFNGPYEQMSYHHIYGNVWPTWVGSGCNYGILSISGGAEYRTPDLCV